MRHIFIWLFFAIFTIISYFEISIIYIQFIFHKIKSWKLYLKHARSSLNNLVLNNLLSIEQQTRPYFYIRIYRRLKNSIIISNKRFPWNVNKLVFRKFPIKFHVIFSVNNRNIFINTLALLILHFVINNQFESSFISINKDIFVLIFDF